ncbi:MAG: PQQ-dependent sugar dehydrogenase [Hellea sp.]
MTRHLLLSASVLLFTACQAATAQKGPQDKVQGKIEVSDFAVDRGQAIYAQHCESCHGANMAGGLAPSMADDNWEYGGTNADIRRIVTEGIEDVGMPAFADIIQGEQLSDLVTYVRRGSDAKTTSPIEDVPSVQNQVKIEDWAVDLDQPWGIHFIGADTALVTEKSGKLWQVSKAERMQIKGIPESVDKGQGGLLDVATDPDFSKNGWIYLSFTHANAKTPKSRMTKIVRGRIDGQQWIDEQSLFQARSEDYINSGQHFGSRITFDNAGHLYFGIGDRGKKEMAQDLTKPNGKIHRIMRDGSIPADNPFVDVEGAYPSIFSYGNRNPQGTIVHPETGIVWETEHGPKGGDELNVIRAGVNYGWPKISYGRNYGGTVLTPYTALPGMAQPTSQWTPSIAVCGLDVYTGDLFPEWKGRLMAGALAYQTVRLIDVDEDRYVSEVSLLKDEGRVRDVTTGPDGAIYVALPKRIVRISPKT